MRPTANLYPKKSQCPFCRSETGIMSELILCSDCKSPYHRECWMENRGCASAFKTNPQEYRASCCKVTCIIDRLAYDICYMHFCLSLFPQEKGP